MHYCYTDITPFPTLSPQGYVAYERLKLSNMHHKFGNWVHPRVNCLDGILSRTEIGCAVPRIFPKGFRLGFAHPHVRNKYQILSSCPFVDVNSPRFKL